MSFISGQRVYLRSTHSRAEAAPVTKSSRLLAPDFQNSFQKINVSKNAVQDYKNLQVPAFMPFERNFVFCSNVTETIQFHESHDCVSPTILLYSRRSQSPYLLCYEPMFSCYVISRHGTGSLGSSFVPVLIIRSYRTC